MQMSSYEVDTMTSLSMLAHLHLPNLFYLSCLDDFVIELFKYSTIVVLMIYSGHLWEGNEESRLSMSQR